ncbi:hypothetical protein BH10ACI1_BH10ACI1_10090 [soil metagenome]
MIKKNLAFIISIQILLLITLSASAQRPTAAERMDAQDKRTRRQAENAGVVKNGDVTSANNISPTNKKIKKERNRRIEEAMKNLPESIADLSKYKSFLKQDKTGLFRLLTENGCDTNLASTICPQEILPDGGAFYSFRIKDYQSKYLSDIALKGKLIFSQSVFSQGIIVKLDNGETDLNAINLSHEAIKFLVDFSPATTLAEAKKQFDQFENGVTSGKYVYKYNLPYENNATYALRVTAYRGKVTMVSENTASGSSFNILEGDERRDVIVLFRILAVEPDGSLTIIWRELQRKASPKLTDN